VFNNRRVKRARYPLTQQITFSACFGDHDQAGCSNFVLHVQLTSASCGACTAGSEAKMDRRSVVNVLGKSALFASLTEADRADVASRMRRATFVRNQLIFSRGDPGDDVYVVVDGQVRLSVLTADGRELALAHAKPGDVFGEIAALDGGERTAGATAITHVEALLLSRAAILQMVEQNPHVARAAIEFLSARLRDTDQRLEGMALHRVEVRLARLLLSALRLEEPAGRRSNVPLTLRMSQSEVALLIGASRPKVNGALFVLEEMGAIKRDARCLMCDAAVLEKVADMQ
jgi:CRP/FNR family cyclic AMP-dependent transcriptional regulator